MKRAVFFIFLASVSFVFLVFIIAFIELNTLAFFIPNNPKFLGITKDSKEIALRLKENNMVPQLMYVDSQSIPLAIAQAMSGKNNFFGKFVLPVIPNGLVLPVKAEQSMLLIDNTIVLVNPKRSDLEVISPITGYLLINNYFPRTKIKSNPKIAIMTKQEYVAFREQEEDKKVQELVNQVKNLKDAEKRISEDIAHDKQMIAANESVIIQTRALKGTYRGARKIASKNKNDWSEKLLLDQLIYKEYLSYDALLKQQKEEVAIQKGNVAYENGVFEPENSIKLLFKDEYEGLVLPQKQDKALTNYFETLVHEYLHYTSFVAKDLLAGRQAKLLKDSFFEEGLTEYFARQVIKEGMHVKTTVAYPVQVKIIEEMMKKIPEGDFADIYFTKDQEQLEKILDNTYGDGFYQNNEVFFEALQYATNKNQMLLLGNVIMKKIGGNPLTNKDIK